VFLTVPNDGGWEVRTKRRWQRFLMSAGFKKEKDGGDPLWTPHHLFGFSVRSIRYLVHQYNFRIRYLKSFSSAERHTLLSLRLLSPLHNFCQGSKLRVILQKTRGAIRD